MQNIKTYTSKIKHISTLYFYMMINKKILLSLIFLIGLLIAIIFCSSNVIINHVNYYKNYINIHNSYFNKNALIIECINIIVGSLFSLVGSILSMKYFDKLFVSNTPKFIIYISKYSVITYFLVLFVFIESLILFSIALTNYPLFIISKDIYKQIFISIYYILFSFVFSSIIIKLLKTNIGVGISLGLIYLFEIFKTSEVDLLSKISNLIVIPNNMNELSSSFNQFNLMYYLIILFVLYMQNFLLFCKEKKSN